MVRKRALIIRIIPLLFQFKNQEFQAKMKIAFDDFWKSVGQIFPGDIPEGAEILASKD